MLDTTFSRLVGNIYDAVIDPGLWTDAIDAIRREFRFHMAILAIIKLPGRDPVVQIACNLHEPHASRLAAYGEAALALWGGPAGLSRFPLEEPIPNSTVLPPGWQQNRFYVEWCRPQGLVDQVVIFLADDRRTNANLSFGCHESRGPLEPETLDDLRLLAPHLRRAVQISRLLDMTTNAAATFEGALALMSGGAILVDAEMSIVYANPAAQAMLGQGDPIRIAAGRIELRAELVPGQLEAAVQAAAAPETHLAHQGLGIPARKLDGTPMVLHVLPLQRRSPRSGAPWKSVAAVFIADTGGQAAVPIDALAILFGLTPMETRVLELTVAGRSSLAVAEALGVAPSTIKTHMLNLFAKTGRHRREDLIKLASDVSLPN